MSIKSASRTKQILQALRLALGRAGYQPNQIPRLATIARTGARTGSTADYANPMMQLDRVFPPRAGNLPSFPHGPDHGISNIVSQLMTLRQTGGEGRMWGRYGEPFLYKRPNLDRFSGLSEGLQNKIQAWTLANADRIAQTGRHAVSQPIPTQPAVPSRLRQWFGPSRMPIPEHVYKGFHLQNITQPAFAYLRNPRPFLAKDPLWFTAYPEIAKGYGLSDPMLGAADSRSDGLTRARYVMQFPTKTLSQFGPHSVSMHPHLITDTRNLGRFRLGLRSRLFPQGDNTAWSRAPGYEGVFSAPAGTHSLTPFASRIWKALPSGAGFQQLQAPNE